MREYTHVAPIVAFATHDTKQSLMNLVYGSFCPLHEGNKHCPCRTLTTNASIWTAAELGDVDRVRKVVTVKGRSPDSLDPHGYTPLHLAAQNGRLGVVLHLLEAGARPDGVPADAGGCGATPLHRAAFAGQLPCVRALLAAGARPSATDASFLDMKTPLHKAAGQGHRDVCVALLDAGANPNATDAAEHSALDAVSLSSPLLRGKRSGPQSAGDDTAGGDSRERGGGDGGENCSTVVLSTGEEKRDWNGVRELLERFGGERRRGKALRSGGESRTGADGGGAPALAQDGVGAAPLACVAASTELEDTSGQGAPAFGEASTDRPVKGWDAKDVAREGGVGAAAGTWCTEGGGDVRSVNEPQPHESCCQNAGVAAPEKSGRGKAVGAFIDGRRATCGSESAGIPCGECHLPKVVMVRALCCGALVCKPCAAIMSARRRGCRRCDDSI